MVPSTSSSSQVRPSLSAPSTTGKAIELLPTASFVHVPHSYGRSPLPRIYTLDPSYRFGPLPPLPTKILGSEPFSFIHASFSHVHVTYSTTSVIQVSSWTRIHFPVLFLFPSSSKSPISTLPSRREVHQNDRRDNSEVDVPDWDDRVNSFVYKLWMERLTVIVVGRIEVHISFIIWA